MEYFKFKSHSNPFIYKPFMTLHVGTIVIGGIPPEKEVIVEELEGQHSSSAMDSNITF
jgi:hypothetical protein